MCKQVNSTTDNTIYETFIREAIKELKTYGCTIVFKDYHVRELGNYFGYENIEAIRVANYYRVRLVKGNVRL